MRDREVYFDDETPARRYAAVCRIAKRMNDPIPPAGEVARWSLPPVSHGVGFEGAVQMRLVQRTSTAGAPSRPQVDRSGRVYFVRGGDMIKIGTAKIVSRRLAELRTSSPVPLTVLVDIAGSRELEAIFHRQFAHLRSHGEWFRAEPALLAFIEKLKAREARRQ